MKVRGKKYLPLVGLFLFVGASLLYQWMRTDELLDRLDYQLQDLDKTLRQIDIAGSRLVELEDEIAKTDQQIELLRKRLPPEPGEGVFAEDLISRFKEHNIDLKLYYFEPVDKEFYTETAVVFVYNESNLDDSLISDILQDLERLVHWERIAQDKVLVTRIYSALLEIDPPTIKSCGNTGKEALTYWPFNALAEKKWAQIDERCSRRNSGASVLQKIKQLEVRRHVQTILSEIIRQLDSKAEKSSLEVSNSLL